MMLVLERRVLRVVLPPQPTKPHTLLTAHMKIYIMYNTASESGSLLTTFRVLGLHARQQHHGPSSLIHAHDGPSSLIDQHSTYTPTHTYPPTHT